VGLGELHHLAALVRDRHRRDDDVDLARLEERNAVADVTATSSTWLSSLKSALAKRWATSTSKPTFLPAASTVPKGGKSVFTPAISLPRFFTVSSVDWADAADANSPARASATVTMARRRDLIGSLRGPSMCTTS